MRIREFRACLQVRQVHVLVDVAVYRLNDVPNRPVHCHRHHCLERAAIGAVEHAQARVHRDVSPQVGNHRLLRRHHANTEAAGEAR